jgi:hypothetical protein
MSPGYWSVGAMTIDPSCMSATILLKQILRIGPVNLAMSRKILQRDPKGRALRVTPEGVDALRADFGVV